MRRSPRSKITVVAAVLAALIVITFLISMDTGMIRLTPKTVLATFIGAGTPRDALILFQFRLPRIVISLLVGAGLALAGCILQGITGNVLSDPGILGINSGAGLMVILFIGLFPKEQGSFIMPFLAFLGAALTALLIYVLTYKRGDGISPMRLVLVGIAVAAALNAAIMVLELLLNPENFEFVATWLTGSIVGTDWSSVAVLLPWFVVIVPLVLYKAHVLNVLNLGQTMATGLGVSVELERFVLLGAAVGLASSCVAIGGGISFVGLVGPHLARRLVGTRHQGLIPVSALMGGLLLLVADTLARGTFPSTELPTGIVVAVIGAPYFLYLLATAS